MHAQSVAASAMAVGFFEDAKDLESPDAVFDQHPLADQSILWARCSGVSGILLRLRLWGARLLAWSLARPW